MLKFGLWIIPYLYLMDAKKTILMILDGWGLGTVHSSDAIAMADTPNMDALWNNWRGRRTSCRSNGKF